MTAADQQTTSAAGSLPRVWAVVPCYNEAERLDVSAFEAYLGSQSATGLIFVNDGSSDETLARLHDLCARCGGRVQVIDQQPNKGKAEAVRQGMLAAFARGAVYVGYFDADLATPLAAIDEMAEALDRYDDIDIVMGARVALLGRRIDRRASRHYSGRVFATAASLVLALPVYDTQCGAKLMRATPATRALFDRAFGSRWIFDVELIARYLKAGGTGDRIYELPLKRWTDVGESKLRPMDFVRSIGEMAQLFHEYRLPRGASRLFHAMTAPFSRYVGAGAIGTFFHYLVLILAVELGGASPVAASVTGAFVGAAINYLLNYHLTFVSKAAHATTLPRFFAVAAVFAALSGLGMKVLVDGWGWHYLVAQVVCTAGVLLGGFAANRAWTFRRGVQRTPTDGRRLLTIARLPVLFAVAFFFRDRILAATEGYLDTILLTELVIDVASTPLVRLLCFGAVLALGSAAVLVSRRWQGLWASLVTTVVAAAAVAGVFVATGSGVVRLGAVLLLLTTNVLGAGLIDRVRASARGGCDWFGWIPGVEVMCVGSYLQWLGLFRSAATGAWVGRVVAVALVAGAAAMLIDGRKLVVAEQAIRMAPNVRVIDRGDFNGIALDTKKGHLFVTGHGIERVRRYDLANLTSEPLEASEPTGHAQGLDYDEATGTVYVYNIEDGMIQIFDRDLNDARRIAVRGLSPGDPWIAADAASATLTLVSEADEQEGVPFLVLDASRGDVLHAVAEDPGNLLKHPTKPLLYLSYFRRSFGLATFDRRIGQVTNRQSVARPLDRMAFWRARNEVLVAAPTSSQVLRFDADTLEPKGTLPALFGVRVIAVDDTRALMISGSLATGYVNVVDLKTHRETSRFYLGPWIRSISLDPDRGRAYVSSNGALYELDYTD